MEKNTRLGYTGRAASSGHTGVTSHVARKPRWECHLVLDPTVAGSALVADLSVRPLPVMSPKKLMARYIVQLNSL